MEKKKLFNVTVTGSRGSTTISRLLSQLATSQGEANQLAKERYRKMHPDAKNVTIKKK